MYLLDVQILDFNPIKYSKNTRWVYEYISNKKMVDIADKQETFLLQWLLSPPLPIIWRN